MGRILYWLAVVPLFLIAIVFAVSNYQTTALSLWPVLTEPVPFPVYGIALVALFIGFVWGGIVSWFQNGRTRQRVRDLQRQSEADHREVATLRERLSRLERADQQASIPPKPLPPVDTPAASPVALVGR